MSAKICVDKNLEEVWEQYAALIRKQLERLRFEKTQKGTLRLVRNQAIEVRETIDRLEKSREFSSLVQIMRSTVMAAGYHKGNLSFWENAIRSALRRSGVYTRLANSHRVSSKAMLRLLIGLFGRKNRNITYLAPIEYVTLSAHRISAETFEIRTFSKAELDSLLDISVRQLFYPWAVIDTSVLSDYWFIVVREKKPIFPIGKINIDLASVGKVSIQYSPYHPLERAIQRLALFDWQPDYTRGNSKKEEWQGWLGFHIPFVLKVSDNLLEAPTRAPSLSSLETEPDFDPATGEELGERPAWYINLDEQETEALARCLSTVDKLLGNIRIAENVWPFISRGLGFLVKGFFEKGLEQLLWHITVLEALLGEDRAGVTTRLARRIGAILGASEAERKAIRKQFEQLYEFRSNLVHGNQFRKQIWAGHLLEARGLARKTLIWFLYFLNSVLKKSGSREPQGLPKREELLAFIDFEQDAARRVSGLIKSLPPGFPAVSTWSN
jgi:virulence-associated protein VapD